MLPRMEVTSVYQAVEKDYKHAVQKINYQQRVDEQGKPMGVKIESSREFLLVDLPEQMARAIAKSLNEQTPESMAKALAATYRSLI